MEANDDVGVVHVTKSVSSEVAAVAISRGYSAVLHHELQNIYLG